MRRILAVLLALVVAALVITGTASASQQTFSTELGITTFQFAEGQAEYEGKDIELIPASSPGEQGGPESNLYTQKWKFSTSVTPIKWHPLSVTVGFSTVIYSGHTGSSGPFKVVVRARTGKLKLAEARIERIIPLEPKGGPLVERRTPFTTYSMTLNLPAKNRSAKAIIVEAFTTPWQPDEGTSPVIVNLIKPTITATLEGVL